MLRLNLKREPQWLTLIEGVRVFAAPATSLVMSGAREELRQFLPEIAGDDQAAMDELLAASNRRKEELTLVLAKAVAKRAILDWEGVVDDNDQPMPVTDEAVAAFLDEPSIYEAWMVLYMVTALGVIEEKKGLPPSPNGISGAESNTAKPARKSAKSAPTHKTSRKPLKGSRSGI